MKKAKIYFSKSPKPSFARMNLNSKNYFSQRIKHKNFEYKQWWVWSYRDNSNFLTIFAWLGKSDLQDIDSIQELWAKALKTVKNNIKWEKIEVTLIFDNSWKSSDRFFLEKWVLLAQKDFNFFKKEKKQTDLTIVWIANQDLIKIVDWIDIARELTMKPANIVNPDTMTDYIKNLFKSQKDVKISDLVKKDLEKEKMWLFLWVNQGSIYQPHLVIMDYAPKWTEKDKPIVLVGKGVTYDSGWYYMKPYPHMNEMHWDMWWSATVLWIIYTLAKLWIKKRVVWAVGLTENMVDAKSYRNWDILTARNWKTVLIEHTDAEGRLVLADVLNYMEENYSPKYMLDFATLTWACWMALWEIYSGVMWYDDKTISKIKKIWLTKTNDKVWQLPLDKYCVQAMTEWIGSDVANIWKLDRLMWGSTAAAFLSQFVENKQKRLHIDIAWTALRSKMKREYDMTNWVGTWAMIHTIVERLR